MSVRDAGWYLAHDRSGLVRGVEARRDAIELEANGIRRLQHAETLARLERLGLVELAAKYRDPPPRLHRLELDCSRWPTEADYEREDARRARTRERPAEPDPSRLGAGVTVRRNVGRVTGIR